MSKKQKRQISSSLRTVRQAPAPQPKPAESTPRSSGSRLSSNISFDPDYTTVVQDLKRIGILSGSLVAILVVLSLIMPYILK